MTTAVLHPGEMGAALAAALVAVGQTVLWDPARRSPSTAERARAAGLVTGDPLAADVIVSICPPHAALDVARSVAGFTGVYVEANAVSPATARAVAALLPSATFVDGGIIGPPPVEAGTTRLYLSGAGADEVAALFAGTIVEVRLVPDASALKMAYAAWTKGSAALLLAARAAAEAYGVDGALEAEWQELGLLSRLAAAERSAETKGWRWVAEMQEIAGTFGAAGQPEGFHRAAAEVYRARSSR
jgi:3-hydroxyisobutyrate dehydrogenase-like beta-hydroxyacid dehydrogenase